MSQYFTLTYWKGQRLLLLVFLFLHVVLSSIYITWQNTTFDEKDYYGFSIQWLHGNVNRDKEIYDSKTPITAVAAVPRIIKQLVTPGYQATDNGRSDLRAGRYMMVVFTLLIAVYLFTWIRRLFGEKAWVIPLLFFLFDPLVLGFSMIITSDMASGACLLAVTWHLFALYEQRNRRQLLFFSVWLGVALVCKASLLYLVPYLALLLLVLAGVGKIRLWSGKLFRYSIIAALVALLIVNLAYFGKGSFRPLESGDFRSTSFSRLATTPVIKHIPVPLPFSYVQSLDMLQYHGEIGSGHPESTHHGTFVGDNTKFQGGFWYYYLYVGLYKIPLASLLLFIAGFVISVWMRKKQFFHQHAWYVLPFILFFVVLSCLNPFQTGFRHFLLVYPFCFLFLASAISFINTRIRFGHLVGLSMLFLMIVSVARFFPWLIPYTNELAGDKKTVFRKIKDSSIDYGHNLYQVRRFIRKHPEYQTATPTPKPGKFIVPAFQLVPYKHRQNASWLAGMEPVGHYQYSMFLFHVSESELQSLKK